MFTIHVISKELSKLGIWRALLEEKHYGLLIVTVPKNKKYEVQKLFRRISPITVEVLIKEFGKLPKFWKKHEYRVEIVEMIPAPVREIPIPIKFEFI